MCIENDEQVTRPAPAAMVTPPSTSTTTVLCVLDPAYDKFLEFNKIGLANLMEGNLPEAYRHICKGFDIARQAMVAVPPHETRRSPAISISDDETSNGRIPTSREPEKMLEEKGGGCSCEVLAQWPLLSREEVARTLSLTKTFDLRMDGLMISADALVRSGNGRAPSLGRDDWTLASAFAAYNIGVVYLIAGTQKEQSNHEAHHDKARIMFESSLALILCSFGHGRQVLNMESSAVRNHDQLCPTGNPIVDVLSLMVLTKTSQAYHFLSRFDKAQVYVEHMADFIRLLRDGCAYSDDDLIHGLIEDHCARLVNELLSVMKLETLAPAA